MSDTHKHTLHLRKGDWDFLESMFKPNGIATSVVIRTLVSNYVDKKRAEYDQQTPDLGIDL